MTAQDGATAGRPRPGWIRVLLWVGAAFLLFNTLGAALLMMIGGGQMSGLPAAGVAAAALAAVVLWLTGGFNVIRTWANPATADFTRREGPHGGWTYDVRPARASRLPVIVLTPLCLVLAALWSGTVAFLLGFVVGAIFLLPGAKHRRRTQISVSPQGLQADGFRLAIEDVGELAIGNNGVRISREPLVARADGVPTSSLVGRALARRQVDRSYTVTVRAEGRGNATVLAGGLTEDCAYALARDLTASIERIRTAD